MLPVDRSVDVTPEPGSDRTPRVIHRAATIATWGALVLFVVLGVGTPLLGTGTFLGIDLLSLQAPWTSVLQHTEPFTNTLLGDIFDAATPQTALIVDGIAAGDLAQWNPYQSGGSELGGLPNSGVYSPLSLPWWIFPLTYAPGIVKVLEVATVAVGMSLFLRRFQLPSASWAMASLVFVSSGFMVSWTSWPQTRVAAFIPLLFWALDRLVVTGRARDIVPVGLVVASMLLGGFPAVTGYSLYAGAAFVVVRAATAHRSARQVVRAGALSLGGVLLGVLLAAWQIVPFAVNAMNVVNFDVRAQTTSNHLDWADLATAVVPGILGDPMGDQYWGGQYNAVEAFSYVGVGAVVLLVAALLVRRDASAARGGATPLALGTVVMIVSVLLLYVGGPFIALAQQLPVFADNRMPRLRVMLGFGTALVAAVGYAALLSPRTLRDELATSRGDRGRRRSLVLRAVGAGAVVIALGALVVSTARSVPDARVADVRPEVLSALVLGAASAGLALAAWCTRGTLARLVAGVGLPVLVLVPAVGVTQTWWPTSDEDSFYPVTPTHAFLADNLDGQRYASVGQAMFPGTNTYYGLRSFGGHSFHTMEWADLVHAVAPGSFLSDTYSTIPADSLATSVASPVLDRFAVRYVVDAPGAGVLGVLDPGTDPPDPAQQVGLSDGSVIASQELSGPVRGIGITLAAALDGGEGGAEITIDVRDTVSGEILATTSTWVRSHGGPRSVAVAGEEIAAGTSWRAELRISGAQAPVPVAATAGGELAVSVVRPADDGLRVVHAGDATVYERETAAERVRWASTALVVADPDERVATLSDPALASDVVVLEDEDDDVPLDGSSTATVVERDDDPDALSIDVEADGSGWVVIEDSLRRPGWSATIDGREATLVPAEHAAAAVHVESGRHTVVLAYQTPGLRAGTAISVITVFVLAVAAGVTSWRRSRGARAGRGPVASRRLRRLRPRDRREA